MWECPSFFPLGDRHVLMISAMSTQPPYGLYTLYMTGAYRDQRFTADPVVKLDGGDIFYYAPQVFRDESGRRIAIGWAREARSTEAQVEAGWAGVMTLPRVLELGADGLMRQHPAPEIETLRGEKQSWAGLQIQAGSTSQQPFVLNGFSGDTVELDIHFDLSQGGAYSGGASYGAISGTFGLLVRRSPGGEEQTEIRCEPGDGRLVVDTRLSSLSKDVEPGRYEIPFDFTGLEQMRLRVFLDRSIIEVYANDQAVITARVYPSLEDSNGMAFFAEGSPVQIKQLDAWQMQSIW
jgi:beta-fructofuranosidase